MEFLSEGTHILLSKTMIKDESLVGIFFDGQGGAEDGAGLSYGKFCLWLSVSRVVIHDGHVNAHCP